MATIFSSVLLGIMSDIATDLVTKIATSLFVVDRLLSFIGGAGVSGIMEASTQQLGLGLILSTLLITVPPMAGMWFNGMMGNFTPFSPLNTWGVRGGQGIVPPSTDGGRSMQQVEQRVTEARQSIIQNNNNIQPENRNIPSGWLNAATTNASGNNTPVEVVKTQSHRGVAAQPMAATTTQEDKTKANKGE